MEQSPCRQWAHKRPSPIGIRRRKAAVQILIPESHEPLHSVCSANSDLTSPQLVLARFNPFPPFAAPIFLPLSFCSLLLPFALLLVCEACQVSVSVRPERLSVAGVSKDPGHHSRFMPSALLLATAARGIGVDGTSCGKSIHRGEPLTQGSEVRHSGAALDLACREQASRGPYCAVQHDDGSGSPSLGVVTCASDWKALLAGALSASSLPARAAVVTTRLAQNCCCLARPALQQGSHWRAPMRLVGVKMSRVCHTRHAWRRRIWSDTVVAAWGSGAGLHPARM